MAVSFRRNGYDEVHVELPVVCWMEIGRRDHRLLGLEVWTSSGYAGKCREDDVAVDFGTSFCMCNFIIAAAAPQAAGA